MDRITKEMRIIFGAVIILVLLFNSSVACAETSFQENYQAIEETAQSVFLVEIMDQNGTLVGTGSGFVAFDEHLFITNYHVVEQAAMIRIISDGGEEYTLDKLLISDEQRDIAILPFPKGDNFKSLELNPSYQVMRGQPVVAIGSPQGVRNTVSFGNVSTMVKDENGMLIQFTAPSTYGSSGGALFNNKGEVIGLMCSKLSTGENMNYAIPIEDVVDLYDEIPIATLKIINTMLADTFGVAKELPNRHILQTDSAEPEKNGLQEISQEDYLEKRKACLEKYSFKKDEIPSFTEEDLKEYRDIKVGDSGEDVRRLKERMYELGYFKSKQENAQFRETTLKYVQEFEEKNGLEKTESATPEMQALFYSNYAKGKNDEESQYPLLNSLLDTSLEIVDAEIRVDNSDNDHILNVKIKNNSKEKIAAFQMMAYSMDAYGRLQRMPKKVADGCRKGFEWVEPIKAGGTMSTMGTLRGASLSKSSHTVNCVAYLYSYIKEDGTVVDLTSPFPNMVLAGNVDVLLSFYDEELFNLDYPQSHLDMEIGADCYYVNPKVAEYYSVIPGIVLDGVKANSKADSLGLKDGDVLLMIGDILLRCKKDIALGFEIGGEDAEVLFWREGKYYSTIIQGK